MVESGFPTCPRHATGEPSTTYRTPLGHKAKAKATETVHYPGRKQSPGYFSTSGTKAIPWTQSTPTVYKRTVCPISKQFIDASQLNAEID